MDERAGLVPVMNGTAFQDICQLQIVVGVGLTLFTWADKNIELVFVQIFSIINRKSPP